MTTDAADGRQVMRRVTSALHRDPSARLLGGFNADEDVWRLKAGTCCVAEPSAAREVMANLRGAFVDTSDFFHTRHGVFGPRSAQVDIGRSARAFLRHRLDRRRSDLPMLASRLLAPRSSWPDAANRLVWEHLRDTLVHPGAPSTVHATIAQIIERAVLAGARQRHGFASRTLFRRKALRVLRVEMAGRRHRGDSPPRDLFDVVADHAGPSSALDDLVEIYLSFVFATVGSIGFALAWSVFLLGLHPSTQNGCEAGWIVREALRLFPVAWLFARTPAQAHDLGGVPVTGSDRIIVCAYLVHRHPDHWDRPDEFVPQRWATHLRQPAYLPFGFGPHTCAGASVVMELLEDLIRVLADRWHISITKYGDEPQVAAALAPPHFTAEFVERVKGGEA